MAKKRSVNQILITDKVFITPEFKRKKKAYKLEFIVSIFLICCLFSYYIYAEYDRTKSEEVSKEVLAKINTELGNVTEDNQAMKTSDNVIIVAIDGEQNVTQNNQPTQSINVDDITAKEEIDSTVYQASDGTLYRYIAIINIPKINVKYPIIEPVTADIKNLATIALPTTSPITKMCLYGYYQIILILVNYDICFHLLQQQCKMLSQKICLILFKYI